MKGSGGDAITDDGSGDGGWEMGVGRWELGDGSWDMWGWGGHM